MKHCKTFEQFTYLGCSISYQFSNDVESRLAKFLQSIGTIKRTVITAVPAPDDGCEHPRHVEL